MGTINPTVNNKRVLCSPSTASRQMRTQINRISRKNATRSERRLLELLKKLHIPFRAKVKINKREVDFVIGKYAIDIDCHVQDPMKNRMLMAEGYIPIHFNNAEIKQTQSIIKWLEVIFSPHPHQR